MNNTNIIYNKLTHQDVKDMPTNKEMVISKDQIEKRFKKLSERNYFNVLQHELILTKKLFNEVDYLILNELQKTPCKEIIIKDKSFITLYGLMYSVLNFDMYKNINDVEKYMLLKSILNLNTKFLIMLNTTLTLTRLNFNNVKAQIKSVIISLIDKEYDVTCLLDKNYYTGLTEKQIQEKYPSKDQTLSILRYKLKNVNSNINTIIKELVKEAFISYTNATGIVFNNLPALLKTYIYDEDLTIREKDWLDIDYILTILNISYFYKSSEKLNALFTPVQRNQLETYIDELIDNIKLTYICGLILEHTPKVINTPVLADMFRDYGFTPRYLGIFNLFKTNHSNLISLSPKFFLEDKLISNTQFTNLLSALEAITTTLCVNIASNYGEEYNEINSMINNYKKIIPDVSEK